MSTVNDGAEARVLARTPLGAHWIDRSSHGQTGNERFVFFQDPQGRIKFASGGGSGTSSTVLEANEAPFNNQFAILGWGSHSAERRFYYITKSGALSERTTRRVGPPDGATWRTGNLRGFNAATYSNLSAIRYIVTQDTVQYHVFYQDPDTDEIREVYTKDETEWHNGGAKLPAGVKGTSIAVARVDENIKLFYQQPDTKIVSYVGKVGTKGIEEWTKANFESHWNYNLGASISATGDKVFTVSGNNKLNIHGPDGHQNQLGDVIPFAPVAAIHYPKTAVGGEVLSVYTQRVANRISELVFKEDGTWTERGPVTPQ
jgi:hypothetical protein